jgi:hypothetical protein
MPNEFHYLPRDEFARKVDPDKEKAGRGHPEKHPDEE